MDFRFITWDMPRAKGCTAFPFDAGGILICFTRVIKCARNK